MTTKRGPLIVLSGPSGCGKSTVIRCLLERGDLPLHLSVSATTRSQRKNEIDGRDYFFWTRERFEAELNAGGFLEWAEVVGNYYGTLGSEVDSYLNKGIGVILDVDSQGAANIRRLGFEHVSIFLMTSSLATYERRLRERNTENEEAIRRRLDAGLKELTHSEEYKYRVINDDLESAVAEIHSILQQLF